MGNNHKVIVMDSVTASQIKGKYGTSYLNPVELEKDKYYLPVSILKNKNFESVHDILKKLEIIDISIEFDSKNPETRHNAKFKPIKKEKV